MSTPEVRDAIVAVAEDWRARFPDTPQAWLHTSEDGTRIWLTDGKDGPVLAMATLPVSEEEHDDRCAAGRG